MGDTVIRDFKKIQLENLYSPYIFFNNYSMSGAKIAFILLVITMISASASAGCGPDCKLCSLDLNMCLDSNLFGRSTATRPAISPQMKCCEMRGVPDKCMHACGGRTSNARSRGNPSCMNYMDVIENCKNGLGR